MKDQNSMPNIISRFNIPEGYSIKIGKGIWAVLSILLCTLAGLLSQVSSSDYRMATAIVYAIAMPAFVSSGYYFYSFRDRVRWFLVLYAVLAGLAVLEMTFRVWLGLRII